jgi:hypothetical protein
MMWLRDTLNLLGARWTRRADTGYDNYIYTLPNGDEVTTGPHERWWYLDQSGDDREKLWQLAYPRVEAWRKESDEQAEARARHAYNRVRVRIEALAEFLRMIEWDDAITVHHDSNQFRKFPNVSIRTSSGRSEVWCEFDDDGSILHGSAGTSSFTGIPSMNKAFKKRYEFGG